MDRAVLLVANRLDQVEDYPDEALRPTISTTGLSDNPVAWFIVTRTPGNDRPIETYGDFMEDVVQERLERVKGVAATNLYGGSEREMRVVIDPDLMALYGLTVENVVAALRAANASISAGDVEEGKRRYVVRAEGEFETVDHVRRVVLTSDESLATGRIGRVTVGDIAEVRFGYKDPRANIRFLAEDSLAVNAVRSNGANVIETMEGIYEAIEELNERAIPEAGLVMSQVYDETVYIKSSISLVRQNIWIGGTLAAMILLIFLRSVRATLVVSMAIPISVVAAFVAMAAMGAVDQRHLARRHRLRGRHGGGRRHRRARKHLPPPRARHAARGGCVQGRHAGVDRGHGFGLDHGDGLRADPRDGA